MKFGNLGLLTRLTAGAMVPVALVVVLTVVGWRSMTSLGAASYVVDHTHRTIESAKTIEKLAADMEIGFRGYLLVGKEEHLGPYNESLKTIKGSFDSLKAAVADDPTQVEILNKAEQLISQWHKTVAEPQIAVRRQVGTGKDMKDLAAMVREGSAKDNFAKFGPLVDELLTEQGRIATASEKGLAGEQDAQKVTQAFLRVKGAHRISQKMLELVAAGKSMEAGVQGYLLTGDEASLFPYFDGKERLLKHMGELRSEFAASPSHARSLDQMEALIKEWVEVSAEPSIALRRQIDSSMTMANVNELVAKDDGKAIFDRFRALMTEFVDNEERLLRQRDHMVKETERTGKRFLLLGTLAVLAAAFLISVVGARTITKPITGAMDLAEAISTGDLTRNMIAGGGDELGRLGKALNRMVENLRLETRRNSEGINILAATASEISATAAELAAITSKTSSAVTQTTTTVEEVKQAARISGDKAKAVAEEARQALKTSEEGKKATEETIEGMNLIKNQMESIGETVVRLSEHGRAIEEIIGSVQDLADQSNLLAVNASIEAARAGDQGRGFAVVAHEIKTLAEQSRQAAQQVRTILEENRKWVSEVVMATEQGTKAVEAGVKQSGVSGESIGALVKSVQQSSQAASVIEVTSEQQYVGVNQVATAMMNIEQAMAQTVSGSSELEAASRRLEELGSQLKDMNRRYKITASD